MARAKKTPSGMWKVRVYSHTDAEGKQHLKAFTAPTKAEAEAMAAEFTGRTDRASHQDLTVKEALDAYISAKEGVLSPSTIRGYRQMEKLYYDQIGRKRIQRITSADAQVWVSDLAGKVSSKTVSNVYGLFTATLAFFAPSRILRVKLPQKKRRRVYAPSSEQVQALYKAASPNLKRAIALEAFASMRRSEACALVYGDIQDGIAHVHRDLVRGVHGWHLKEIPKTSESDRFVRIPEEVLQLIGTGDPEDRVVPVTPDTVTECFGRLRDSFGLDIRYHDLRHYYASIAAVVGIPPVYVDSFAGWMPGSKTRQQIYENQIRQEADRYARKLTDYFDDMLKT